MHLPTSTCNPLDGVARCVTLLETSGRAEHAAFDVDSSGFVNAVDYN
jgi:hypothetical protein